MRKPVLILLAFLVASLGALAPAGAGAASASVAANPKVAIIVGATGSVTAHYRDDADVMYNEAIKYTNNVVRVYSPDATWSKVKAAVNGASIVIYMGHGNGWPSPYGNDASYTTKDGFGLNYDVNGDGALTDSELKYYGEPSIRTLTPAPNAVVLLFHLCYASGNSEPGTAQPTLSVAQQRADNYAAAFQAAGARAVVALGLSNDPYYVRALFTTQQTVRDYWLAGPDFHNNVLSFASTRTPGSLELLDPSDATPASFYRSFVGTATLQTGDVTGAAFAPTDAGGPLPATVAMPGPAVTVDGDASAVPVFSPNGDGSADSVRYVLHSTQPGTAQMTIRNAGGDVVNTVWAMLVGGTATLDWHGLDSGGAQVPDGTYGVSLSATDLKGNTGDPQVRHATVFRSLGWVAASPALFFPQDGDSLAATTRLSFRLAAPATVSWTIINALGAVVRTIKAGEALAAGAYNVSWNGRNDAGAIVPRGTYGSVVTASDGTTAVTQRIAVGADAFRIVPSNTTPGRGQRITVSAISAEPLGATPRLTVIQPGISAWSVALTRSSSGAYVATITLKASSAGTLRLKVSAPDSAGRAQYANLSLALY